MSVLFKQTGFGLKAYATAYVMTDFCMQQLMWNRRGLPALIRSDSHFDKGHIVLVLALVLLLRKTTERSGDEKENEDENEAGSESQ